MVPVAARKQSALRHYIELVHATWRYAGKWRTIMLLNYGLFLVANIFISLQPYVIGELINVLQLGGDGLVRNVMIWLAAYVGVMFAFWCFHGPGRIFERRLGAAVRRNFYETAYHQLTRLPLSWHHNHHSGNVINRINKAAAALYDFASAHFVYLETGFRYVMTLGFLALLSWPVALFMMVFSWAMFAILTRFDRRIIREIHEANEKTHRFSARLFDYINNMVSVIALTLGRRSKEDLGGEMNAIYPHIQRESLLVEAKWAIMMCGIAVMYFLVLGAYIGWHLGTGHTLLLGNLVAIFQYMTRLDQVYFRVADLYQKIAQTNTDRSAADLIHNDYTTYGIEDDTQENLVVREGKIEFENVGFSYIEGRPVFENFNLTIAPGEKVGLVGMSGAGKSTLIQLLMRFYKPDAGHIRIDGQDIHAVNMDSLRRSIALIPQDTSLFETTLYENILLARQEATREEIEEAAMRAGAHDFIRHMAQGYDTLVGERGIKLSGGQRQRVAIARAFLKASPILILDEATSALDSVTERNIQDVLENIMVGRTVIVIAHRLSTLRNMDRVIVMEQGRILEQGSHDELVALNGAYARMWAMQAGGFLSGHLAEGLAAA